MHEPVRIALYVLALGRPSIRLVGFIQPALTLVAVGFLIAGVIIGSVRAARRPSGFARPVVVGLAMWLVATAYLTMLPGHSGRLNLVPFDFGANATPYEPLTNVCLFLPLGILLTVAEWRGIAVIGTGLGLSLVIETTQYLLNNGRTADVNDVMTNTLGTIVGWLVALAVRRVARRQDPGAPSRPVGAARVP